MTLSGIPSTTSTTPAATAPGAPPGVAPTSPLFDDLLAPALRPARHDVAAPGKSLPDYDDERSVAVAGFVAPIMPNICRPASMPAVETTNAATSLAASAAMAPAPTIRFGLPFGTAASPADQAMDAPSEGDAPRLEARQPSASASSHPLSPTIDPLTTPAATASSIQPTSVSAVNPSAASPASPAVGTRVIEARTAPVSDALPPTPAAIIAPSVVRPDIVNLPAATARTPIGAAARVFADAIRRAFAESDRQPAQPAMPTATAIDLAPHAVAAAGEARHAALDMQRDTWPAQMIARIEALRDGANANDTSIRLIPDALGTIDVSLERDGERVHVHFVAEQADTRQLLADTRPQLNDLAAARGLTLSLGGGDTGANQPQRRQPAAIPSAPPRAAADNHDHATDQRIA